MGENHALFFFFILFSAKIQEKEGDGYDREIERFI